MAPLPVHEFESGERDDKAAGRMRLERGTRDDVVFLGGLQASTKGHSDEPIAGRPSWSEVNLDEAVV